MGGRRTGVTVLTVLAAGVLLSLTACGQGGSGGEVVPGATPSQSPSAGTELTISVDDGSGKRTEWTLTCDPAGGSHPDAAKACQVLADHGETALPPVPKDRMCAELYGGPEKATITGTWKGKPVTAKFARHNGCEIGRWNAMAGLLPVMTGKPSIEPGPQ